MRALIVVVALSAALGGCLHQKEIASAQQADAACKAQNFKTMVELVRCRNEALRLASPAYAGRDDLVDLAMAQRMVLAEKVDKGQMSRAEYDLEIAKTRVAMEGADRDRSAQERAAQGTTCTSQRVFNTMQTICN